MVKINFDSAFPSTPRSLNWTFQVFRPKLCMHFLSFHFLYSANRNSKFLRNDGIHCCQTLAIRKETEIESILFSCHWNIFVGTTKQGSYIHHPRHESYVTYFMNMVLCIERKRTALCHSVAQNVLSCCRYRQYC